MSKYDAWKAGLIGDDGTHPNSPNYDDSREVAIDERAAEILERRLNDHTAVTDAVEEIVGFTEYADSLASDMAAVLTASEASFDLEAARFFGRLYKRVKRDMADDAKAKAELERDEWEREQQEMKGGLEDAA